MFSIDFNLGTILTVVYCLSLLGLPAQASNYTATAPLFAQIDRSFGFIPPEDSGQPRTNRAGGRRDQLCNNSMPTPSLTLLLPPSNQGTTTALHPTVLAYLPQVSAQQAFVTLEDEDNNYLYHTTFKLPDEAGIVSFQIPETAPALELNKYYKVSLAMVCGEILDPNDPVVEGWIKRIELDAAERPSQTTFDLGAWYAQNGVWFDAVNTLANLRKAEPDNGAAIAAWEELLQSVGLEMIDTVALLEPMD